MKKKRIANLEAIFTLFFILVVAVVIVKVFSVFWNIDFGFTTTETQAGAIFPSFLFSCSSVDRNIQCTWFGCPANEEVLIFLNDGSFYKDMDKQSGTFTFGPMQSGRYSAVLTCGDKTATSAPISI